ncbi:MAG: ABC transporter permease [Oligoflexus sp.]
MQTEFLHRFKLEAEKWLQTMRIAWSNYLAYKLNFLLLVIGPTLVFFFIKYNLWTSIYGMEGVDSIQGYDLDSMLAYQVWVMIVSFLAQSYHSMNLAEDIRLGRISSYLVYPFNFSSFHLANFIAIQGVQFIVSLVTVTTVLLAGLISLPDILQILKGLSMSWLVGLLWFQISFIIGLAAFWLEETWVLRVMFTTIAQFFSGALIPLELYPQWLLDFLYWTPFPYLTFVPVKQFMGEFAGSFMHSLVVISIWLLLSLACARFIWQRGLRLYTAAGM